MVVNGSIRLLATILSVLLLAACASTGPQPSSSYLQAQNAFEAKDYERAHVLIQPEAEKGNPDAQYALGYMYYNGLGTQVDMERAVHWIRAAAMQGHPEAVEALGRLAVMVGRERAIQESDTRPRSLTPKAGSELENRQ